MDRSYHRGAAGFGAVACGLAVAVLLVAGGCAPVSSKAPAASADQQPGSFDPATAVWNPSALAGAAPGLIGWRSSSSGGGALVAFTDEATETVVWSAAPKDGTGLLVVAVDPLAPRVLCAAVSADQSVGSLVLLDADGTVEELPMPEGYEGVIGAVFVADGRPLVVVYHTTTETFDTQLGVYERNGTWRPVSLAGELPEHQFVERIHQVPATDAVALVLKTPGGEGDRDDEALVLARLEGEKLVSYTAAFRADALVGATPLWGVEGVSYPSPSNADEPIGPMDLIQVAWNGRTWVETPVAQGLALASGVETGLVTAHAPDGTFWVRSVGKGPHGLGTSLASIEPKGVGLVSTGLDLTDIDWFAWHENTGI